MFGTAQKLGSGSANLWRAYALLLAKLPSASRHFRPVRVVYSNQKGHQKSRFHTYPYFHVLIAPADGNILTRVFQREVALSRILKKPKQIQMDIAE